MEVEIWKDIPNYEGLYQASNLGNIKSFKNGKEKNLSSSINCGYLRVCLTKNGKSKAVRTHVLVAMAFHGHIPIGTTKGLVVDHKDNNKLNNHVDNLQLIPHRENCSKDKKNKTSKYTGVHWDKVLSKWSVKINFKERYIHLGHFDEEVDAANAYQKAKKEWEQGLDLNVLYPKKVKTSQYIGVSFDKVNEKWVARYKWKYIGRFKTELEAHKAIQNYKKQYGQ